MGVVAHGERNSFWGFGVNLSPDGFGNQELGFTVARPFEQNAAQRNRSPRPPNRGVALEAWGFLEMGPGLPPDKP